MTRRRASRNLLEPGAGPLAGALGFLLAGSAALAGCAGPSGTVREDPSPQVAWTPPPASPSILYSDLRVEESRVPPAAVPGQGRAAETEEFAARMSLRLGRTVRDPSPSPDGKRMVFVVADEADGTEGQIWISRIDGSLPYLLHGELGSAGETAWRRDHSGVSRIYFSSRGQRWSFRPVLLDVEETES